ncbi:TetR/AcrR family transcriptional regulator [Solibacillus daqui]|uniref:TetR/AcrR family transcriptional regulator n=1 Tax=Solibacillus daqui TaxID=2912187 RepID=UPI00236524F7|nr:TetR/AcrR family transcriptional regulator [Solibacillus daqui]
MDRRKRKSREALRKACLELVREKGFEAMTILDITTRADLNRGTFYLHFVDKYDMVEQFEKELISKIEHALLDDITEIHTLEELVHSRKLSLIKIFDCFQEDRDLLEIIFNTKGVVSFQQSLSDIAETVFEDKLNREKLKLDKHIPPELFRIVIVSLMVSIAQYWLKGDKHVSSEVMAHGFLNIMMNGPARATGLIPGVYIDIEDIFSKTQD